MTKITRTPARLNTGHVLPAMTIFVDVIPVRSEVTAADIAAEVTVLLRRLTNAERIDRGHVSDARWHLSDPAHSANVTAMPCKALLTTEEAAELLEVSPSTVRRMISAGTLNAERAGTSYRIPRVTVLQAIEERS